MSGNKFVMKGFLCLCLCVCLLLSSFSLGDFAADVTDLLILRYRNLEIGVNGNFSSVGSESDEEKVIIEGYGGGDYANSTVNAGVTPVDIEALKKQTEALYKNYKKRKQVSKYCDLKIELYALINELDWYKKLGFCPMDYLYYRAKRLIKQVKKNKLKRTV